MAFSIREITHQFENADGTFASGAIQFTLTDMMTNGAVSLAPAEITANLDASGNLSQNLASNVDTAVWSLATSGSPVSGQFQLTWNGDISPYVGFDETAASLQTKLNQLDVLLADVVCTGGPLTSAPIVISGVPGQAPFGIQASNLQPGSAAITQTTPGTVPAAPQNTQWRVDMRIQGATQRKYFIVVPAGEGAIDLFDLIANLQQVN